MAESMVIHSFIFFAYARAEKKEETSLFDVDAMYIEKAVKINCVTSMTSLLTLTTNSNKILLMIDKLKQLLLTRKKVERKVWVHAWC